MTFFTSAAHAAGAAAAGAQACSAADDAIELDRGRARNRVNILDNDSVPNNVTVTIESSDVPGDVKINKKNKLVLRDVTVDGSYSVVYQVESGNDCTTTATVTVVLGSGVAAAAAGTGPVPASPSDAVCAGEATLHAQPQHHQKLFSYSNDLYPGELEAAIGERVTKIIAIDGSALDTVYEDFGLVATYIDGEQLDDGGYWYTRSVPHKSSMATNGRLKAALREVPTIVTWLDADKNERQTAVKFCSQIFRSHSPVALDLNGDGTIGVTGETTAKDGYRSEIGKTVAFDITGDGNMENIEWFAGDGDGILVDNRDGMAAADMNGSRLFGDANGTFTHGYEALARLDTNGNGELAGTELTGLVLWLDNGDAIVQDGEFQTLAARNVAAISTQMTMVDGMMRSTATMSDGSVIMTEDVWFAVGPAAAATTNTSVLTILGAAGLAVVATAVVVRRRNDNEAFLAETSNLDAELAELLEAEHVS